MRFYGMSYHEILNLPSTIVEKLWEAISVLESQEILVQLKAASYPSMTETSRRETHQFFHSRAFPISLYPPESSSLKDFAGKLKGGLLG